MSSTLLNLHTSTKKAGHLRILTLWHSYPPSTRTTTLTSILQTCDQLREASERMMPGLGAIDPDVLVGIQQRLTEYLVEQADGNVLTGLLLMGHMQGAGNYAVEDEAEKQLGVPYQTLIAPLFDAPPSTNGIGASPTAAQVKKANFQIDNYLYDLSAAFMRHFDTLVRYKCVKCGVQEKVAGQFKQCSRCKSVCYCGVGCQRGDWAVHKVVCGAGIVAANGGGGTEV